MRSQPIHRLLPFVVLLAGCGGSYERTVTDEDLAAMAGDEEIRERVPVSGTVTVDGTTGQRVQILAYTRESGMEPADRCRVEEDGTFCFTTYRRCDGMQPGTYRLAFVSFAGRPGAGGWRNRPDQFQGRYSNPMKNDFELVVESGQPLTGLTYELTTGN